MIPPAGHNGTTVFCSDTWRETTVPSWEPGVSNMNSTLKTHKHITRQTSKYKTHKSHCFFFHGDTIQSKPVHCPFRTSTRFALISTPPNRLKLARDGLKFSRFFPSHFPVQCQDMREHVTQWNNDGPISAQTWRPKPYVCNLQLHPFSLMAEQID